MESAHPPRCPVMYRVSPERFEELASEALDSIPEGLARYMENVAVVVADQSEGHRSSASMRASP